jgi:CheY-like chemotaxis protein
VGDLPALITPSLLNQKCILVAEDDPAISHLFKGIIEEWSGHQVMIAANGFQALNLVRRTKPDLFLFDYHLPGIDGLELYHRLHADRAYADIPVLFLSAHASEAAFEQQQLALIRKPSELEDLLLKIEALLTG